MSNISLRNAMFGSSASKPCRALTAMMAALLLTCTGFSTQAQQANPRATITANFKDADLAEVTAYVQAATGKTFLLDPRVKAQVTVLSSQRLTPEEFYQLYLSILEVHQFVAVPAGNVIKIIPNANAKQVPANDLPGNVSSTSDELVTQVVAVRNVSAALLVPILRPLMPQYANISAYTNSNMLIITDRANNVNRMIRIIERLDKTSDEAYTYEIIQMQNATAAEVYKTLNSLNTTTGAAAQATDGMQPLKIVTDERTNSIIVSGDKAARLRIKTLIAWLDTPLQSGGNTRTRYLEYADAETLATSLKAQISGITQSVTGTAAPGGVAANAAAATAASAASNSVSIWADKATNALVVSAPPKIMDQIMTIVDSLDVRRAQVLVEAIVVEVSATKAAELGFNWALYGSSGSNVPAAVFNGGSTPISTLAGIAASGDYTSLPTGTTAAIGRIVDSGASFAAILRALQEDGSTNVISTPSIITMDNEEAKIEVTQQVPLITGQYTSTGTSGSTSSSTVNPFTTVQRQDVGTKLTITPKINKGTSVSLKISQEASSLTQQTGDAGSLITNKRSIANQVMVEDGETIVLGGLLEDNVTEGTSRVPILGSIPIIGNLFKARNSKKVKTNMLVFIKPTILRNGVQSTIETSAKYNFIRDLQQQRNDGKVILQPGEKQPILPDMQAVPTTPPAPAPAESSGGGLTTSPLNDGAAK
ncbi:MAG: type II secretion system secretin GspD [Steroidobacteraceae bacterium]